MLRRAVDRLLTRAEQREVIGAIAAAESRTSGEIKVHVETRCRGGDALVRTRALVRRLRLDRAALRNGVLIYVAVHDRKFAVAGDVAVHDRASQLLWDEVARMLGEHFRRGEYRQGLLLAVARVGDALAAHFPPQPGGDHPVSNRISGR